MLFALVLVTALLGCCVRLFALIQMLMLWLNCDADAVIGGNDDIAGNDADAGVYINAAGELNDDVVMGVEIQGCIQ